MISLQRLSQGMHGLTVAMSLLKQQAALQSSAYDAARATHASHCKQKCLSKGAARCAPAARQLINTTLMACGMDVEVSCKLMVPASTSWSVKASNDCIYTYKLLKYI
jgi:hypothetical protein